MKFKLFTIFIIFLLTSCDQNNLKTSKKLNKDLANKYKNSGFALIYKEDLNIKKLDQRSLNIYHETLKRKSFVKITNPVNQKSLIAEVKSNKVDFSKFYNSIITPRIAQTLELDLNEPYIEITLISQNSTFVAKKSKTFDEEKKVAQKAPIDGIKISNLNDNSLKKVKNNTDKIFSYSIKVADFYYKKTALLMTEKINSEVSIDNMKIIKLSKNNYRVILGPFNDISSLQESFDKINSLYFENLEILKDD